MTLPNDLATIPNIPQDSTSSNPWDPGTISNIIFSAIMVFIGIIAIWQAHRAHSRSHGPLHEEDIIGIQLLSRASTLPLNASPSNDLPRASTMPPNASPNNGLSRASTLLVDASQSMDLNVPPLILDKTVRDSTPKAGAATIDDLAIAAEASS